MMCGATHVLQWRSPLPEPEPGAQGDASLTAPLPGQVVAVLVEESQAVRAGETLLILESMKREQPIRAPHDGTAGAVPYSQGEQVPAALLLEVHPTAE